MTGAADGASGLSQIRFLDLTDGWAYGPQLFATHTGGRTWAQVDTGGLRVTALETVGDRVFAVWASCTGDGPAYGASCTRFTLYSASATGGTWAPVGAPTTGLTNGTAREATELVLTGSRGYLLAPGGALYSGPVDGRARALVSARSSTYAQRVRTQASIGGSRARRSATTAPS